MRRWRYIKLQTASCCLVRASAEDIAFAKAPRWDSVPRGLIKTSRVVPANHDCLQRHCTSRAHWVFSRRRWYETCMDDHRSCPDSSCVTYTRQGTRKRCDPKANTNRVSPAARAPATLCTVSGAGYRRVPEQSREQCLRICAYRGCDSRGGASRDRDDELPTRSEEFERQCAIRDAEPSESPVMCEREGREKG